MTTLLCFANGIDMSDDGKRVFLLLAVHADPTIMYNDEMSADEAEERARDSLTGVTIVSIDLSAPRLVRYHGLCLRSAWRPLSPPLFRRLKRSLIYRDKCCNQRNFASLVPVVTTSPFHSPPDRRLPDRTHTLQSAYRYDCNVPEELEQPLRENRFVTGLAGPEDTRYAEHCRRLAAFVRHECARWGLADSQPVTVYHKLPLAIVNWLPEQLRRVCPNVRFKFLGYSASAKWVRTSPHCRYRANHNACLCEICLTDEYAPQLVNALQTDAAYKAEGQRVEETK